MCDTFTYRSDGRVWFGKNSDREPNEAHEVVFIKGGSHPAGASVRCTYIEIPEVAETCDVILSKPAWMWGAEMGVNSFGVAIGNEAIFTKEKPQREPALTGMDILRLALQRSSSARNALDCMISLLTTHGQGGNCGYSHPFYYNNSFLITDRVETWVLETIGKNWAAKRFISSTSISNALSLHADWDDASPGFQTRHDLAAEQSDPLVTKFSQAGLRRECMLHGLNCFTPEASLQQAFSLLRSHNGKASIPIDSLTANTICMHAGFGPVRIDQTTGSLVVDYSADELTIWITGTAAPCLSVFRPVFFSQFKEDTQISRAEDWLTNEEFHRRAIFCPESFIHNFQKERDELESDFIKVLSKKPSTSAEAQIRAADQCQERRYAFLAQWRERALGEKRAGGHFFFRKAWRTFNQEANIQIEL